MASDIKHVLLTGAAASEITGASPNGNKKTRKGAVKRGGEAKSLLVPSVPSTLPTPSALSALPAPPALPAPYALPAPSALPSPSAPSTPSITEGGTKIIKVELKKRATAKRVHLQPKRGDAVTQKKAIGGPSKKARKATLSITSLHKRMKRAKKMTRKVKEMPLSQLREHLIQKKLIKPTSKAPESVLRQIAADAQIVAGKAL